MRILAILLLAIVAVLAMRGNPPAPPDPFVLTESAASALANRNTTGQTPRVVTINPVQKTLVLMVGGQSNMTTLNPTYYAPLNPTKVSHLNIYDGAFYPVTGPLLGTNYAAGLGPGNLTVRVADSLVGSGKFDQVLLVNIAVDGSAIEEWTSGAHVTRPLVAMRRLAARGITPATTGVQFAFLWGQGEAQVPLGTSQASYAASLTTLKNNLTAYGFSGKIFVNKETWNTGTVSSAVQAAQVGFADNVTTFVGGDLDSLNNTYRQASDQTHFLDNGATSAASLITTSISAQY